MTITGLRALLTKMTPRPWSARRNDVPHRRGEVTSTIKQADTRTTIASTVASKRRHDDALGIVAIINHADALLDMADALKRLLVAREAWAEPVSEADAERTSQALDAAFAQASIALATLERQDVGMQEGKSR